VLNKFWAIFVFCLCGWALPMPGADTYSLADGSTLTGDVITFSDTGIKFRLPDDRYTEQMPWTQFSQDGLKQLAQNPKIRPLVEPFIELPPVARVHQADHINLRPVTHLDRPARQALLGAMFSSSVVLFLLLLIYAASLYAGFEVAICRGRPIPVVMGLAAVLPVVGPAIFFLLPTHQPPAQSDSVTPAEAEAAQAAGTPATATASGPYGTPGAPGASGGVDTPVTTDLAELAGIQVSAMPAVPAEPAVLQVYKRGQFTFNRRFMETKFAGFFPAVRSAADEKLDFTVKLPKGYYLVHRITNIGMNDVHFEIFQEGVSQEILVPFADIQEITLKSKTA